MDLIKTKVQEYGICCNSCQEDVNDHGCFKCSKPFENGDTVYCKYHSHSDCEHFHENCKSGDE